mmetsp:Transcript_38986/g.111977  ORF Transcript_38986/g.111977 Transcript_38986/m.111977 type:complete len:311 (-) Transcript_38986:11-943(-)
MVHGHEPLRRLDPRGARQAAFHEVQPQRTPHRPARQGGREPGRNGLAHEGRGDQGEKPGRMRLVLGFLGRGVRGVPLPDRLGQALGARAADVRQLREESLVVRWHWWLRGSHHGVGLQLDGHPGHRRRVGLALPGLGRELRGLPGRGQGRRLREVAGERRGCPRDGARDQGPRQRHRGRGALAALWRWRLQRLQRGRRRRAARWGGYLGPRRASGRLHEGLLDRAQQLGLRLGRGGLHPHLARSRRADIRRHEALGWRGVQAVPGQADRGWRVRHSLRHLLPHGRDGCRCRDPRGLSAIGRYPRPSKALK